MPGQRTGDAPPSPEEIDQALARASRAVADPRRIAAQAGRRQKKQGAPDPSKLWEFYVQLVEVEQAFKELKDDLSIRPIYHQNDERIEAPIFVAFMIYRLQVSCAPLAPGLTPRSAIETMAAIQTVDVELPTTDGRTLTLSRYTEPELGQKLLIQQLKMSLPDQPPPRIAPGTQAQM